MIDFSKAVRQMEYSESWDRDGGTDYAAADKFLRKFAAQVLRDAAKQLPPVPMKTGEASNLLRLRAKAILAIRKREATHD